MTTIAPVILTCPSCHGEGRHFSTRSSNSFGWRQWSDGWGAGTYGSTETGLLHCSSCDMVFPEAICEWRDDKERNPLPRFLGRSQGSKSKPQVNKSSGKKLTLFERMAALSRDGEDHTHDLDDDETVPERSAFPTRPSCEFRSMTSCYSDYGRWGRSAREALAANRWLGDRTELVLRLQWWWDWNALARESAPNLTEALAEDAPAWEPVPVDMVENLERLLPLISRGRNTLLAGEILRRLGRFEDAIVSYETDEESPADWRMSLIALARQGKTGLVEMSSSE